MFQSYLSYSNSLKVGVSRYIGTGGTRLAGYFVIAPLASRCKPISLLPASSGLWSAQRPAGEGGGRISAVSLPIALADGTELLVHPDYLQSTSTADTKRTKWFLNPHLPLSSLASGMFALTRVRAGGAHPIIVAAAKDPLNEVGVIELPVESATVCLPRAIAGVVKNTGEDVRISRHWRLGCLHGWLTLQLRFLVFHGPCKLMLKGCRGIRVESGGSGRMINQAATLGFSANLAYSNRRCETFVSYWTGKESLFNDVFAGTPGFFVFEEMPAAGTGAGVTGRGPGGVTDALLKVFGI